MSLPIIAESRFSLHIAINLQLACQFVIGCAKMKFVLMQ